MRTRTRIPISLLSCVCATLMGITGIAPADNVPPPPIRIVYFVPADRQPLKNYAERCDRVMKHVQAFYRNGMEQLGYGPRTFSLETDAAGKLKLHRVQGALPAREYGRNDAAKVRAEVKKALAKENIDADKETLVIFQVLLDWVDGRAVEVGPFVGGGNHLHGTGYFYDDERLDPKLLPSKQSGGYYVSGPCSIGQFNTHYIGGIAHEMGHAFGLPHDHEIPSTQNQGRSLMGAGNHTYGQELRGEGRGTFLTLASGTRLLYARAFAGDLKNASAHPQFRLTQFSAIAKPWQLTLNGRISAAIPAHAVIAYNDPVVVKGDYDAIGWTCRMGKDGAFQISIPGLKAEAYDLRLAVCHINGAVTVLPFSYTVSREGMADVADFDAVMTQSSEPIAGRWQWSPPNQVVTLNSNGDAKSSYGGRGHWTLMDRNKRTYEIRWEAGFLDKLTLSPDGTVLSKTTRTTGAQDPGFTKMMSAK